MVMRSPVALRSRAFSLSEREKEEAARVEDRLAGTTCHATLMEVAVTNFRSASPGDNALELYLAMRVMTVDRP